MPQKPVCQLESHSANVNAVQWAPHSSCHVASGSEDSQALIWDLSPIPKPIEGPCPSHAVLFLVPLARAICHASFVSLVLVRAAVFPAS